ncbi:MAG: cell division protein FtsA [Crocinitomicaceae bacterium]|jgi:cell division protein FtsA|nr:cell division protein FtsA [Crocinitomicaceae bacterium]
MSKIVVGLDIGTTKIACFVGRENEHGKIEILSVGKSESLGVMRGIVANIEKTVESIGLAVQEAQNNIPEDKQLNIRNVIVGVAGQHIKSLQHRGIHTRTDNTTEISRKDVTALIDDMYRLVMQPGEEIIDVIPQEFIIDSEQGIKEPIGHAGVRLEANFHIITGNVSAIMNINRCVQKADLQVKHIILEPIASADAVLSAEEKEAGVVLVDIGGGTTDIAIFHDGLLRHTAVIPFGGNVITEDIREGCSIMKKQAEKLKVKYGSAFASESSDNDIVCIPGLRGKEPKEITLRNLASIIQSRMEEIIELVHYEIKNSGYEKRLIGGIVVTGGGSQMKHITQLFEYVTGMGTRIGYPTEHLANTNDLDELASPMFATGIGLVMQGFKKEQINGTPAAEESKPAQEIKKSRTSFFEKIINSSKEWFAEED